MYILTDTLIVAWNGTECVDRSLLCAEKRLGNDLQSVIQSSGVSILERLRMYGSLGENNWDAEICPL